jgi:DNA modification methylase
VFEQASLLPSKDLAALVRHARSELSERQEPKPLRPLALHGPAVHVARRSKVRLYVGDVREVLGRLEPEFAQCVMTSPPFWGLRDYKIPPAVWGGSPEHEHVWSDAPWRWNPGGNDERTSTLSGGGQQHQKKVGHKASMGAFCACGAWLGQLGLEPWPQLYVEHIVEAFRAVWRALRHDGVVWLEIGDSYAGSGKGPTGWSGLGNQEERQGFVGEGRKRAAGRADGMYPDGRRVGLSRSDTNRGSSQYNLLGGKVPPGIKPKDLLGIPWRVAFALQADGWYLRNDNIWHRPNPMPESMKDRCTRSHSYVFQLSKRRKVYYDWLAIAEPTTGNAHSRGNGSSPKADLDEFVVSAQRVHRSPAARSSVVNQTHPYSEPVEYRNKRTVWTIPTKPFPDAHFATFPPDLVEDPIKAATSERGACGKCGAPWARVISKDTTLGWSPSCAHYDARYRAEFFQARASRKREQRRISGDWWRRVRRQPGLGHWPTEPQIALDPFSGAGTVALVAARLGLDSVGIDPKREYVRMAERRLLADAPMLVEEVEVVDPFMGSGTTAVAAARLGRRVLVP